MKDGLDYELEGQPQDCHEKGVQGYVRCRRPSDVYWDDQVLKFTANAYSGGASPNENCKPRRCHTESIAMDVVDSPKP